ncbi:MAG TPA: zinc ribbon domain-containing protein [Pyrinomonadaceae bacterium]|jgi:hypothetical protein|nr:zinc ribbon domain-containing protein [Pyrinomonadaceae bacterium]
MYCPRCSQQQVSDDVRFCSRCGFKLGAVADLLLTDGAPTKGKGGGSTSVIPTLIALTMLFFALLAVAASLAYVGPESGHMRTYSIFFAVISLIFLLSTSPWRAFRKLFSEDTQYAAADNPASQPAPGPPKQAAAGARAEALPPAQTLPITGFSPQRVQTAEMVQPPSITEHTTKLLGEE